MEAEPQQYTFDQLVGKLVRKVRHMEEIGYRRERALEVVLNMWELKSDARQRVMLAVHDELNLEEFVRLGRIYNPRSRWN